MRSTRVVFLMMVAFIGISACSSGDKAPPTTTTPDSTTSTTFGPIVVEHFESDESGFYDLPDPLPKGNHGDLIRVQPIDGAPQGAKWQRIMYLSESVPGSPIAVTGVVTVPDTEPPPEGWPLIANAHGTTGIADACAPSVSLGGDGTYAAELKLLSGRVASDGFVLVSTDYEGLGVEGRHPYLVGVSAGRSVLDSLLAVQQLSGVRTAPAVGIVGYSQGGHAAAWANQLASNWAPELSIVGVLAGAPATEVPDFVAADSSDTRPLLQAREVLVTAGLAASSTDLDVSDALSAAGLEVLDQLDEGCEPDLSAGQALTRVKLTETEPWASALKTNVPGSTRGAAPVLIVHSRTDAVIPIGQGEAFASRLCATGQVVEMRELPDGEHVPTAVPAYLQGLEWIQGLMDGAAPVSTCS